ncbi:MAG: NAD-dependent epimerase/dehydratase family protein, partial [Hyphomonadaceae bacterium]|nr:NAD-dependent epimerase/dehydratase family protein [Hyphomonadaceae bacterium]
MFLVTGAAGFIGYHVVRRLLEGGAAVVGVDSLDPYYDPALKRARLARLGSSGGFRFVAGDVAAEGALDAALPPADVRIVVHLAAQAGVRHSLEAPFAYERANVAGHLAVLEYARRAPQLAHLVYASSSSVYGDRTDGPFHEDDRCDAPESLYAATKRACELMSESYARLYDIPQTGLRFFTVYGPWGRPDMAYYAFTDKILTGQPLTLYGDGLLARDFTYIDDVVETISRIVAAPPSGRPRHALYNIGNSTPSRVLDLVAAIERATGAKAITQNAPLQPGDVTRTFADHGRATRAFGFTP